MMVKQSHIVLKVIIFPINGKFNISKLELTRLTGVHDSNTEYVLSTISLPTS